MSTKSTLPALLAACLLTTIIIAHATLANSSVEGQCCAFPNATHRSDASDKQEQPAGDKQEQPAGGPYLNPPLQLVGYIGPDKARDIIWRATGWTVVNVTRRGSYYSVTVRAPDGRLYEFRVDARTGKID